LNNLLKKTKLHFDVIELNSKNTTTDNLKLVHDRLRNSNKNMNTTTDNEEIINMLKLIQTKIDLHSIQLSELKNTLI